MKIWISTSQFCCQKYFNHKKKTVKKRRKTKPVFVCLFPLTSTTSFFFKKERCFFFWQIVQSYINNRSVSRKCWIKGLGDYLLLKKKRFFSSSRKLLPTQGIFSFLAHSAWAEGKKLFFYSMALLFAEVVFFVFLIVLHFFSKFILYLFFLKKNQRSSRKRSEHAWSEKKTLFFFANLNCFGSLESDHLTSKTELAKKCFSLDFFPKKKCAPHAWAGSRKKSKAVRVFPSPLNGLNLPHAREKVHGKQSQKRLSKGKF